MPVPVREQIIQRIAALVNSINGAAGGFNYDLSAALVHRNRDMLDLGDEHFPAAVVWDSEPEEREAATIDGWTEKRAALRIEAFVLDDAADDSTQSNYLSADLEKALLADDPALDALIQSIQDTSAETAPRKAGSKRIAAALGLLITYQTPTGDPYTVSV